MALIRERGIPSVLGNHELAVKSPRFYRWFNPQVRSTIEMTLSGLSERTVMEIRRMEAFWVQWGCRFVHGFPPRSPLLYLYQMSERKIIRAFDRIDETRCFIGHTHNLALVCVNGDAATHLPFTRGTFALDADRKYLVNVGAVGQPRDGRQPGQICHLGFGAECPWRCDLSVMILRRQPGRSSMPDTPKISPPASDNPSGCRRFRRKFKNKAWESLGMKRSYSTSQ